MKSLDDKTIATLRSHVESKKVTLGDGTEDKVHGFTGENPGAKEQEIHALQLGMELGMTLIDTAEMYARGGVPLEETIEGMEQLKKEGKILRWGVSNLDMLVTSWSSNTSFKNSCFVDS
jgi:diketogulonate reductase-like aldo/keto reductase